MTFRDALLVASKSRGLSLRKVAQGANVSYEQIKKMKQRPDASTNADDAERIAAFFGVTMREFLAGDFGSEIQSNGVTPEEVEQIRAALARVPKSRRPSAIALLEAFPEIDRTSPQSD